MILRSCKYHASCLLMCLATIGLCLAAARGEDASLLRIGMVQSFFHDVPKVLVDIATAPFSEVMRAATGLNGELVAGGDPFDVAQKLSGGQLQLGVFYSFELAWVREKHPEIKPLMVAVNKHHQVQAFLLARKDSAVHGWADLKGKDVALPARSKEHCRLYLKQRAFDLGQATPKEYFGKVVPSASVEVALDDLCQEKVDAAVVDSLGIEFYRDLKPGCYARFKVVQASELFPPAVIAYREGTVDQQALRRVREGLLHANELALGREMMKMWKIHSFEPAPDEYADSLAAILKAYPRPDPAAKDAPR